jgi:hypothetical protein
MDIVKDFNNLEGWINYRLSYSDGSSGIEQFSFKNLSNFKYYLGELFKKGLKEEYDYEDITLIGIHIQDEDNKFHVHMSEDMFIACCHNEIDSNLIDKNYTKKLSVINKRIEEAKGILDSITK